MTPHRTFSRSVPGPPESSPTLSGPAVPRVIVRPVASYNILTGFTPKGRVPSDILVCPFTFLIKYNPILKHRASCVALAENKQFVARASCASRGHQPPTRPVMGQANTIAHKQQTKQPKSTNKHKQHRPVMAWDTKLTSVGSLGHEAGRPGSSPAQTNHLGFGRIREYDVNVTIWNNDKY